MPELTPLIERWIGGLPSTGKKSSAFRDMGVRFPSTVVREEVRKGKDPASQTVISFFGDAGKDEFEMHRLRAAANVLSIRLREILREELSGTYGVSVGYDSSLPLPGYGAVVIQFGSAPENVETLTKAVFTEVERLKAQGPTADDVNKVKEMEKRDLETNARQNQYWLGSMQTVHMYGWDPTRHPAPAAAGRQPDPRNPSRDLQEVPSVRPSHRRHAEAEEARERIRRVLFVMIRSFSWRRNTSM